MKQIIVIGMGYVGLPLAHSLSGKFDVIGFDIDSKKIESYRNGIDVTNEIGSESLKRTGVKFTSDESDLKGGQFFIIAVPTPINDNKLPDLGPVISASELVGRQMGKGAIIVYESTVYPGVTEDICGPILERSSGMRSRIDFKRITPFKPLFK